MSEQSTETAVNPRTGMCRCGHMPHDVRCQVRTQYGACWCSRGVAPTVPTGTHTRPEMSTRAADRAGRAL